MKIGYLIAGAFLEWVIRTKEGKDFANKAFEKGYVLIKDNLKNVLPESKSEKPKSMDRVVCPDSRYSRDNKPNVESSTQRESGNTQTASTSR